MVTVENSMKATTEMNPQEPVVDNHSNGQQNEGHQQKTQPEIPSTDIVPKTTVPLTVAENHPTPVNNLVPSLMNCSMNSTSNMDFNQSYTDHVLRNNNYNSVNLPRNTYTQNGENWNDYTSMMSTTSNTIAQANKVLLDQSLGYYPPESSPKH